MKAQAVAGEGSEMIFVEMLFALAIALLFTVVFTALSRRARSRRRLIVFFSIIFFAAWAGGVWIAPVGPTLLGVYWLSFFIAGLIFALVMEAISALSSPVQSRDIQKKEENIEIEMGMFFWVLFFAFVVLIVVGYILRQR
jgi:MFS family permease